MAEDVTKLKQQLVAGLLLAPLRPDDQATGLRSAEGGLLACLQWIKYFTLSGWRNVCIQHSLI